MGKSHLAPAARSGLILWSRPPLPNEIAPFPRHNRDLSHGELEGPVASAAVVAVMSYQYFGKHDDHYEELYLLLLLATLGCVVLVASVHFVSFLLGLEILSVSLSAMVAYFKNREDGLEAGIKYLYVTGYLPIAAASFFMDREYNRINRYYLDQRWPEAYVAANPDLVTGSQKLGEQRGLTQIGPDLRALLKDAGNCGSAPKRKILQAAF